MGDNEQNAIIFDFLWFYVDLESFKETKDFLV